MGMAGLAYGAITPNEPHFCPGSYRVPGSSRLAREGKGGVHGQVALRVAIAKSCDVYFYSLAYELGVDKMHDFLAPFGYGEPTGIDIAGEEPGILPSKEWKREAFKNAKDPTVRGWYPGDSVNMGVGQGFMLVTPMQNAHVAAVLAAKGAVFKPRLVTGLHDPVTNQTTVIPPVQLPHVKGGTPEQWEVIMEGMHQTMTIGTAQAIATSAEYTIAGKTGTAQSHSVGQNERLDAAVAENLRDHAWFIAFAPAEDPQIAVAVLVEHGGFGASAAAPIARKMMDAFLLPRLKPAADVPEATPSGPPASPPATTAATAAQAAAGMNRISFGQGFGPGSDNTTRRTLGTAFGPGSDNTTRRNAGHGRAPAVGAAAGRATGRGTRPRLPLRPVRAVQRHGPELGHGAARGVARLAMGFVAMVALAQMRPAAAAQHRAAAVDRRRGCC